MKRILFLLFFITSQAFASIIITPDAPSTDVGAYVLIDHNSGKVLAEKNPHERRPPASLTKLMTSYIVFTKIREKIIALDDKVRISTKAWKTGGSKTFLKVNDRISLEDLLHGMIVQSGNDASVALAEHVAGSESTFVDLMNQYAAVLGMNNSHFQNASGLPHDNQFSSAYDIAILAQRIISEFPEFYQWYSEKSFTFNGIKQPNRNRLLWLDNSVDGLKTGHTSAAGYCLAASAKRVGMRLISVVLDAKSNQHRIDETQKFLDYGFRFFETHEVTKKDEVLAELALYKGKKDTLAVGLDQQYFLTVTRGRFKELDYKLKVDQPLIAPIDKNQSIGTLEVSLEDEVIQSYPLVAMKTAEQGNIIKRLIDSVKLMF